MSRIDRDLLHTRPRIARPAAALLAAGNAVRRRLTQHVGVNAAIVAFSLVFIGAAWTAVVLETQSNRADTIANAVRQNSNLAIAFEEHTIRTIKGIDAAARFVAHEYARLGMRLDLAKAIEDGSIDATLFNIVSVVNESGDIILSSKATGPVNYADREHFKFHQLHATAELFISKPVLGRISGVWQIPMTRRINKPDGSFGGAVVLSVNPGYFTDFYKKADIGTNGIVNLVGLDGISRARRGGGSLSSGVDMSNTTLFKERAKHKSAIFAVSARLKK